jgi:hypothetical protein
MSMTPEEYQAFIAQGASSSALKAPLVSPTPENPNSAPNRLCSPDGMCGHGDAGCRRSDTILKWESENSGQYLPADLQWGARDLFFFHQDKLWYDKSYLETLIAEDLSARSEDLISNTEYINFLDTFKVWPTENSIGANSLEEIRTMISTRPQGLLNFVEETNNFFVFENPGLTLITANNINKSILETIESSFQSSWRFDCFDPADCLYIHNGTAYWTDIIRVGSVSSDILQSGISLISSDTFMFFPFSPLTTEQREIISIGLAYFSSEYSGGYSIVDL